MRRYVMQLFVLAATIAWIWRRSREGLANSISSAANRKPLLGE